MFCIASFHWQFYDDVFTCLKEGFGFLFYLVYPFPLDLYKWVESYSSNRSEQESAGNMARYLACWVVDTVSSVPKYGLYGVSWAADRVTQGVEKVNMIVKKSQEEKGTENTSVETDFVTKEASSIIREEQEVKLKNPIKTSRESIQGMDYSLPKNPRTAGDQSEQNKKDGAKLLENVPKSKKVVAPEDITVPTKNIEAFKTEVKIQEKILKIGKKRARELFAGPVMVSVPWIREEKTFVPEYKEFVSQLFKIQIDDTAEKSGVFEQEKEQKPPKSPFDAPIPTSSVFERDSTKLEFEVRAKVNTPSPRASFIMEKEAEALEQKHDVINQVGVLALSGNIHTSMYNIHAACENEDENIDELENLREPSPEADTNNKYRNTDIQDIEGKNQKENLEHNTLRHTSDRTIGIHDQSDYQMRISMLSEAPRESPDLKTRFSVKDEIAQLR